MLYVSLLQEKCSQEAEPEHTSLHRGLKGEAVSSSPSQQSQTPIPEAVSGLSGGKLLWSCFTVAHPAAGDEGALPPAAKHTLRRAGASRGERLVEARVAVVVVEVGATGDGLGRGTTHPVPHEPLSKGERGRADERKEDQPGKQEDEPEHPEDSHREHM